MAAGEHWIMVDQRRTHQGNGLQHQHGTDDAAKQCRFETEAGPERTGEQAGHHQRQSKSHSRCDHVGTAAPPATASAKGSNNNASGVRQDSTPSRRPRKISVAVMCCGAAAIGRAIAAVSLRPCNGMVSGFIRHRAQSTAPSPFHSRSETQSLAGPMQALTSTTEVACMRLARNRINHASRLITNQ